MKTNFSLAACFLGLIALAALPSASAQLPGVLTILHSVGDHASLTGPLVRGADGNLYGEMIEFIGSTDGTVFRLTPDGTFTAVHTFNQAADGTAGPSRGLTAGGDGSLYGTTEVGGTNGTGAVFRIAPDGTFSVLCSLPKLDPFYGAVGRLLLASDGNLYGVISVDHPSEAHITDYGSIFRVTPAGEYTVFHQFNPDVDGTFPQSGLIESTDGNFYGTTQFAAGRVYATGNGTVFQITPAGAFTTLHILSSTGNEGKIPTGRLVQSADGFLYGTTTFGGQISGSSGLGADGNGTVFRVSTTGDFTSLYRFNPTGDTDSTDANNPDTGLIQGPGNLLYGTSAGGNDGQYTAVYAITSAGQETILYRFNESDGTDDYGTSDDELIADGTGNVYGITHQRVFKLSFPQVALAVTTPSVTVGSGGFAQYTLSIPAALDHDLFVKYTVKGSGVNGVDYHFLKGTKKIKAGKTSKPIKIFPQGDLGGANKKAITDRDID